MSFEEMNPSFPSVGRSLLGEVYHKVNWLIGLGLLLVVLGALGLVGQVFFSFLSVGFIAAIFILAGIFQGVHAFQSKGWKSVTLQLLFTFIYAGLGVFMLVFPGAALEVLTLWLSSLFLLTGSLRCFTALHHRMFRGWAWSLLSGLLSILLAILMMMSWPASSFWLPGLLLAIEILIQGFSLMVIGLSIKSFACN